MPYFLTYKLYFLFFFVLRRRGLFDSTTAMFFV